MEIKFLVETALLTHGLVSASNADIHSAFEGLYALFGWIDKGELIIGTIEEYLPFRERCDSLIRIDCNSLDKAQKEGLSGALTASGTMAVCKSMGIPLAVTCGMGGIGEIKGETLCPDLPALAQMEVTLISTSPKDMLDIKATFNWLRDNNVSILGNDTDMCTGYIFPFANEHIKPLSHASYTIGKGHTLILNPIPENKRVYDADILKKAISKGLEAEQKGEYYHPAVNKEIDRLTNGYSTKIQLMSLADNIRLAHKLTSR